MAEATRRQADPIWLVGFGSPRLIAPLSPRIPLMRAASMSGTVLAVSCLLVSSCGGNNSPTGPGGGANFQATVGGTAWQAQSAAAGGGANGTFSITGVNASGAGIGLVLYNLSAPGTYPLGVGGTVFGGTATLTEGAASWWTALTGAAGTVTITQVSSTRIAGTFSFTAVPLSGGATGTRAVTAGSFDLAVTATGSIAVPANVGNRAGGMLGGQPWNAATVVMISAPASGVLSSGFSNDTHSINLTLSGFTGPGTYQLNTGVARYFGVVLTGTTTSWGGTQASNSGSVVITSVSASRVVGSYTATLQPGTGGAGTLTITGTFDLGIP